MKANNQIEAMPLKDIQAAENALKTLRQKMTFVIPLTPQERQIMRKPGESALAAVDKTLAAAQEHRSVLPQGFDLESFKSHCQIVSALNRCLFQLNGAATDIEDTLRAVAVEPLDLAAEVRGHVRAASKRSPDLQAVAQGLATTTARRSPKARGDNGAAQAPPAAPPAPAEAQPATATPAPAASPADKAA